jgi:hypothetical protein
MVSIPIHCQLGTGIIFGAVAVIQADFSVEPFTVLEPVFA